MKSDSNRTSELAEEGGVRPPFFARFPERSAPLAWFLVLAACWTLLMGLGAWWDLAGTRNWAGRDVTTTPDLQSTPMNPASLAPPPPRASLLVRAGVWVLGMAGLGAGAWQFQRRRRERELAHAALQSLATSFAHLSGRPFFEAVSREMTTLLGVDFVFVGELDVARRSITVLGGSARGEAMGDLTYALADTPCNNVVGRSACCYAGGVQGRFPKDQILVEMGAEGYVGSPIFDKQGQPLGIMVALHPKPLAEPQTVLRLFNLFVDRVAAEMQRGKAEAELRRLSTAVNASHEAIFMTDTAGVIQFVNAAFTQLYGYTAADVVGRVTPRILKSGKLPPEAYVAFWKALQSKQVVQGELINRTKDGRLLTIESSVNPVLNERGDCVGFLAIQRDITARKRTEEELQASRRRFQSIVEGSPMGIHMYELTDDDRLVLTGTNPASDKILGIDTSAHLGQTIGEAFPLLLQTEVPARYREAARDGKQWSTEQLFYSDGVIQGCFEIAAFQTGPRKMAVLFHDITARKRAEVAQSRLATAVEQAAETIVITDTAGKILYANPAFERTTGYTRAEALGQTPRLLKSGKHDAEFYRQMWETVARGEVWQGHVINRRKDGTLYEEDATLSPVRDSAGTIVNYVAVKRDVTREVQLEAQFRQAQKLEAIGQLAGGVAHDFNNILAALLMGLELLHGKEGLDQETRASLKELEGEAKRAARLTRQLLMFSRRSVLEVRVLDVNEVIADLLKMLGRLLGEHVTLAFERRSALPAVEADAGLLEQVLMNLAVNARDAMPGGGRITLATDAVVFSPRQVAADSARRTGQFVCLTVADTGCGMDAATLKRLFEPFFTTKEKGKGTGLGLATVDGIVAQHGGWVEVESTVGRGTTFRVFLPASTKAPLTEMEWKKAPAVPRGRETLLVVEDDAGVRLMLVQILQMLGYRVLQATNGQEAMNLWRDHGHEIHLLLTDMVMPEGMTGLELADRVRAEKPDLKVIVSSGYHAELAHLGKATAEGIVYLPKPYDVASLGTTVRRCLDS